MPSVANEQANNPVLVMPVAKSTLQEAIPKVSMLFCDSADKCVPEILGYVASLAASILALAVALSWSG